MGPVLYDQLNGQTTANPVDIASQDFEAGLDGADSEAADDFVVPEGMTWSIDGIDVDGEYFSRDGTDSVPAGFHVRFWSNDASTNFPSGLFAARLSQAYTTLGDSPGDVQVALDGPVVLPAGTWWVSVQARLDYGAGTHQWFWHNRHDPVEPGRRVAEPGRPARDGLHGVLAPGHVSGDDRRPGPGLSSARHRLDTGRPSAASAASSSAGPAPLPRAEGRREEARACDSAHPPGPLPCWPHQPPEVGPAAARQGGCPEPAGGSLAAAELTRQAGRRALAPRG